ncbi:MAG TPA: hypothetical protein PLB20_08900 [Clostridia bacterium]|nr:hypothetical protein [Clostridia bacterium]
MKQLFDTIAQAEMLGFAFLVIAAMVICVAIIFFFALIIVLDKKSIPVLRPARELDILKKHMLDIKANFPAYVNNILSLDEGKDLKKSNEPLDIGVIILKNYGNSSAVDIQVTNIGSYKVEEDFSNKYVSLQPGESVAVLVYIPKDLLSSVKVSLVKVKSKNYANSTRTEKFSIISDSELSYRISEKCTLHPFIQM